MLKKIFFNCVLSVLVMSCSDENKNNYQETNAKSNYSIKLTSTHDKKPVNIIWNNFSDGVKKAKNSNKKMFLDFYTDWCTYCKKMENETFTEEKVYSFINKNFIPIKINADSNNIVEFSGKKVTEKELAEIFGVTSYPTLFFMKSETEAIGQLPGFVHSDYLYDVANYIYSDSYKTLSFEEFKKKFSS